MNRVVKDYETREEEILASAQQLFFTKGYDKTSVSEIIKANDIAKGTFYHYFDSKLDLLLAVVDRMVEQGLVPIKEMMQDESLSGKQKFEQIFRLFSSWKAENVEYLKALLSVLYQDDNALLREKINEKNIEKITPIWAQAVKEAVEDGDFDTRYPEETGRLILQMGTSISKDTAILILQIEDDDTNIDKIKYRFKAYEDAIERVLGAETGSLNIIDRTLIETLENFVKDK